MRSRQINFFLTPDDQAELLRRLDPDGQFVYLARRCLYDQMQILPTAVVRQMGQEPLGIYIARAADLDTIVFNEGENDKSIDVIRSPVIEFNRCYLGDEHISDGRLYVVNSYFDAHGRIARKNDSFLKWSERLIAKTRRCLTKEDKSFYYFGTETLQLKRSGFKTSPF
ncbi:hypothetical protein ACQR0Z_19630 [Bradyrhizobium sp. HKCCYLS3077]|uniref:hypothetical protein n=1 Tax=Bradyrhizobium sp. HKCCYLS3077 TaxID=3420761 RepID=UPI003EBF2150